MLMTDQPSRGAVAPYGGVFHGLHGPDTENFSTPDDRVVFPRQNSEHAVNGAHLRT